MHSHYEGNTKKRGDIKGNLEQMKLSGSLRYGYHIALKYCPLGVSAGLRLESGDLVQTGEPQNMKQCSSGSIKPVLFKIFLFKISTQGTNSDSRLVNRICNHPTKYVHAR